MAEHVYRKMEACINTSAGWMRAYQSVLFLLSAFSSDGNDWSGFITLCKCWHHFRSFHWCGTPQTCNGKLNLSSRHRWSDGLTLVSRWDARHPHIAAVAKGMMTSCLLLSERLKEDIDDKGWAQSAGICLCAAVGGWHVERVLCSLLPLRAPLACV